MPGSSIATWMNSDGPHTVYVGSNQHIWQLWNIAATGGWYPQDLTALLGAPSPELGTPLHVFVGSDGDHIYFIDVNHHLSQFWWNGSQWIYQDLWLNVAPGDQPSGTTGLTSYTLDGVVPYLMFLGNNGYLEQEWLQGSNGMVQISVTELMNLHLQFPAR
jgi:hypothetical protein